jgi:hypothetical protein
MKHRNMSLEASGYRETWETYLISTSPDRNFYKSMSLKKDNFFINRYVQRAHHTNLDVFFFFFFVHQPQRESFKRTSSDMEYFIYKYINPP